MLLLAIGEAMAISGGLPVCAHASSLVIASDQASSTRPQRPKVTTSRPKLNAKVGTVWIYAIEVETDSPPVSFKLEQGPPGMTVSDDGVVAWRVVAEPNPRPMGAVKITDANGESTLYGFDIVIEAEDGTVLPPKPEYKNDYRARRTWEFDGPGYRGRLLQIIDGPSGLYFVFDLPVKEDRIPRNAVLVREEGRIIPGTLRVISTADLRAKREELPTKPGSFRPNLPPYDFMVVWEPVDSSQFVVDEDNPRKYTISVDFEKGSDSRDLD